MMDTILEFLSLFIVFGAGFIVGVVFVMTAVILVMKSENPRIIDLKLKVERLEEELELATGSHREDEHSEVERSPPLSPVGDMPGAGRGTMGDASLGRKR